MDSFPGTSSIPIKHGRKSQTLHFFLQAPISAGRSSIPLRIVTKSCTTLSFALSLSSKHYQKGISQGHNCNVYSYALTEARKKQNKKPKQKKQNGTAIPVHFSRNQSAAGAEILIGLLNASESIASGRGKKAIYIQKKGNFSNSFIFMCWETI